jgi:hypothetical protein
MERSFKIKNQKSMGGSRGIEEKEKLRSLKNSVSSFFFSSIPLNKNIAK